LKTVYLGLGSNLGDREATLRSAVRELEHAGIQILRLSSFYETEPQGYAAQPWFLNAVAEARTELFPRQLLHRAQAIERALGRKRSFPNAPRTIDIDILLFGNFIIHAPGLEVPHPRYRERRFVLAPLAELAPDLRDPVTKQTAREMLAALKGQSVQRARST
jgi:2-amino-4-hydroxy-6-hydroxymethyldihydropteridine diphosphokinase